MVEKRFAEFVAQAGRVAESSMLQIANEIKETSQALVPVRSGHLRATAYTASERQGSDITVEVGYNQPGDGADYAVFVHENLAVFHPTGQAKFLEQAVILREPTILKLLEKDLGELTR